PTPTRSSCSTTGVWPKAARTPRCCGATGSTPKCGTASSPSATRRWTKRRSSGYPARGSLRDVKAAAMRRVQDEEMTRPAFFVAAAAAFGAFALSAAAQSSSEIDVRAAMQDRVNPAMLAIWDVGNNAMNDTGGIDPALM